jgi:hypothetical protein
MGKNGDTIRYLLNYGGWGMACLFWNYFKASPWWVVVFLVGCVVQFAVDRDWIPSYLSPLLARDSVFPLLPMILVSLLVLYALWTYPLLVFGCLIVMLLAMILWRVW